MDHIGFISGTLRPDAYMLCALRNGTRRGRESKTDAPSLEGEQNE